MEDGVIITFRDGQCAIYSSALLYSILAQAEVVTSLNSMEDESDS